MRRWDEGVSHGRQIESRGAKTKAAEAKGKQHKLRDVKKRERET